MTFNRSYMKWNQVKGDLKATNDYVSLFKQEEETTLFGLVKLNACWSNVNSFKRQISELRRYIHFNLSKLEKDLAICLVKDNRYERLGKKVIFFLASRIFLLFSFKYFLTQSGHGSNVKCEFYLFA